MKIFLFLSLLVAPLAVGSRCGQLTRLLVRTSSSDRLEIREGLSEFSPSPLITELEAIHIEAFQSFGRLDAGAVWRKGFYPFWVFENAEAMELLLESFPDGFVIYRPNGERNFEGLRPFIDQWQADFENFGGKTSLLWRRDRAKFLETLVLHLALAHEAQFGIRGSNQPLIFNLVPGDDLSAFPGYGEILKSFHSFENFQYKFADFARQRRGQRTPRVSVPSLSAYDQSRRQMEAQGLDAPEVRHPFRLADARMRSREALLQLAVQSVRTSDVRFPLEGLFLQLSPDLTFSAISQIKTQFGTVEDFMRELTDYHPRLYLNTGARVWTQELLIVAAIAHIHSKGIPSFEGKQFQSENPEGDFYISLENPILKESQMKLADLSRAVMTRLDLENRNP